MWVGDPGSGPAHRLPMAWRGCWQRSGRTVHPACRRTQTLSGGAGQPLPQSLRAAFCGHPHVTAPGASALCAREALGCSSGDTSGAGRTNLPARPWPLAGDEPCRASRPPRLGQWGGSVFSGSSPDSRPRSARWAVGPQRRSGVAHGCDDRV